MLTLSAKECRVLGVLIEKAQTTPGQYPMTLNAIVNGCNQKSNRLPVMSLGEDDVIAALDAMRGKDLVREVMLSGSRVAKYRHTAREALALSTSELVVLTELMLRGPQTVGEIRGRASRMHPLESTEVVDNLLAHMQEREHPLVRDVGPAPGGRATRFAQLLCPDAHPLDAAPALPATAAPASPGALEQRIEALENRIHALTDEIERIKAALTVDQFRHAD